MIKKIIASLARKIKYNETYKDYFELSQTTDKSFVLNFENTKNIFFKFAFFLNPNFDQDFKRDIIGNEYDAIEKKYIGIFNQDEFRSSYYKLNSLIKFQGMFLDYEPSYLFNNEFSELHEKFSSCDPHIEFDTNKTRLRTFNLWQASEQVLRYFNNEGEFLFAGINFGTAPLILSHIHKNKKLKFFYIDPFDGRKNTKVNLDPLVFEEKLPNIEYELIIGVIPNELPKFRKLIFVHLNTTNFDAEFDSMNIILKYLEKGGIVIWDIFGWLDESLQLKARTLLDEHNVFTFIMPTRQLLIIKF